MSFGTGATLVCLLLWPSLDAVALPSAILLLAAAPLLFSAFRLEREKRARGGRYGHR